MSNKFMPFLVIGGGLFLLSNLSGRATETPVNYDLSGDSGIVQQYSPLPQLPKAIALPGQGYSNGYEGYENMLIGDMVHQMAHEGEIRPATLNEANGMLQRCAKLAGPKPPVCN